MLTHTTLLLTDIEWNQNFQKFILFLSDILKMVVRLFNQWLGDKWNFYVERVTSSQSIWKILKRQLSGGKKEGFGLPSWDKAVRQMKIKMTVSFQA